MFIAEHAPTMMHTIASAISNTTWRSVLCLALLAALSSGCTTIRTATFDQWTYTIVDQSAPEYRSSLREIVTATAGQPMAIVCDSAGVLTSAYGTVIKPSATSTSYENVSLIAAQDSTIEIEFRANGKAAPASAMGTTASSNQSVAVERRSIPIRSLVRIDALYPDDAERAAQRRRQDRLLSAGKTVGTVIEVGGMILIGLLSLMALIFGLRDPSGPGTFLFVMGLLGLIATVTYFAFPSEVEEDSISPTLTKPSSKVRKSWFFTR